ncbi:ABC transporter substrate-binding protein [Microlunatus soli]|uniref:ABC-type branched-chain amino acid transport system, substrate-binding protein n=1 Tax=Microlunatus soli TaxID=630515 RepID=A0A1H1XCN4_9ACTN|nr:ABC transporter substrate-binding protein [Microlunatus soli]SDT06811.1 ABC-type branched-chain amino acid transport system, substrate-binding protein [Microlunatus soli]
MTKGRLIALIVAVVVVLGAGAGVAWWQLRPKPPPTQPAAAAPVAVSVPEAPRQLTIGVLLTLSAAPGEGAEWKNAAEGSKVAAQRLSMGGIDVKLVAADDKGTTDGAGQAVRQLAKQHVSGIVVASSGAHLKGAGAAAKKAHLPLLFPYEPDTALLGDNAWATGPSTATIGKAMAASLQAAKLKRPLVIDAGGGVPEGVRAEGSLDFASGGDTATLVKHVQGLIGGKNPNDAVIVSGPANTQATVVRALQGGGIGVPVYVTPQATSPSFGTALAEAGGSLSTSLTTIGPDWGDSAALRSDPAGQSMSAFLSAVRLMAADDQQKSLMGDQTFAEVAAAADAPSHDAVVAIVRAAAAARSADPAKVSAAMSGLKLDHDSGLAGPTLDFGTDSALDPGAVGVLRSSDQDLGVRPQSDAGTPRLIWFAAPTGK